MRRRVLRGVAWMFCAVLVVVMVVYARLLFGPVSLGFLTERMQAYAQTMAPDQYAIDIGAVALSLDPSFLPTVQFSPVTLTDRENGATVRMASLEISVSPMFSVIGQPGASIVMVEPEFQMVQDLFGARLSRFTLVEDTDTGEAIIQVSEGTVRQPAIAISGEGLAVTDGSDSELEQIRSDNSWLIQNFESANAALADLAEHAAAGRFSRLRIRDGRLGMHDAVFGLYKELDAISVDVTPGRAPGAVSVDFSATIGGRTTSGTVARAAGAAETQVYAEIANLDFATVIPFLDDPDGIVAVRGAGGMRIDARYDSDDGRIRSGRFALDLNGTRLRLNNDFFPIRAAPFDLVWMPHQARFHVEDVAIAVGQSSAEVTGDFVLGLDRSYGPTVGMSIRATNLSIHPDDLDAPEAPFDHVSFEGWSAPLYGAVGIDRFVAAREGVSVVAQGRVDTLKSGVGLDLTIGGRGASADDLKRLWPYLMAPEARQWFVDYVVDGSVHSADARFKFPVGSLAMNGEPTRIPDGAMHIELVGSDVDLVAIEGLPQFSVEGQTRVSVRDNQFTMAFERAIVSDPAGPVEIANAAFLNQDTSLAAQVFEISGDITGAVPTLLTIANREPLNLLEEVDIGIDPTALSRDIDGNAALTVIATITMDEDGAMTGADYALNGTVSQVRSRRPIHAFDIADAQLAFTASQAGFHVTGTGRVEDVPLDVQASKSAEGVPEILVSTTIDVETAKSFGIDLTGIAEGQMRLVAKPMSDGSYQVAADLTDLGLTLEAAGIAKARGAPGHLTALARPDGRQFDLSQIDLGFGDLRLRGDLSYNLDDGFQSAEFSSFALSPGDDARLAVRPVSGGYAVQIAGAQLDLKPVLSRFFDLEATGGANGSRGPLDGLTLALDVELDRAIGLYQTTAFNLDLDLSLRGEQIRRLNLTGQFGGGRNVSATTNPLETGRVITYASNDIGTLMRFVGVYPRLLAGEGTLVMRMDEPSGIETGELVLRDFSIIDEDNVAQIIGNHAESRPLIARSNRLAFSRAHARFLRMPDRVEVLEAAVHGDSVGGTVRGNINTATGQYDLAGTYVPLFAINNVFQQLPIFGPIFGGRDGEGLIGVTFAVRGPLNNPNLSINPASLLAPGMFRSLFEYRAEPS